MEYYCLKAAKGSYPRFSRGQISMNRGMIVEAQTCLVGLPELAALTCKLSGKFSQGAISGFREVDQPENLLVPVNS